MTCFFILANLDLTVSWLGWNWMSDREWCPWERWIKILQWLRTMWSQVDNSWWMFGITFLKFDHIWIKAVRSNETCWNSQNIYKYILMFNCVNQLCLASHNMHWSPWDYQPIKFQNGLLHLCLDTKKPKLCWTQMMWFLKGHTLPDKLTLWGWPSWNSPYSWLIKHFYKF